MALSTTCTGLHNFQKSLVILKQVLRSLSLSYQLKAKPSFSMTLDYKISSLRTTEYNSICGVIPKEGLVPVKPSSGMTTTKILRFVFLCDPAQLLFVSVLLMLGLSLTLVEKHYGYSWGKSL